jgi:hypothetical protein
MTSGLQPNKPASKHKTQRWNAATVAVGGITFVEGRHSKVNVTRNCRSLPWLLVGADTVEIPPLWCKNC